LREAQMQAEPPYLPYVGIILSDLTFIEYAVLFCR
jgi:hypothetical protein